MESVFELQINSKPENESFRFIRIDGLLPSHSFCCLSVLAGDEILNPNASWDAMNKEFMVNQQKCDMKLLVEFLILLVPGLGMLVLWSCLFMAGLSDRQMPRCESRAKAAKEIVLDS